MRRRRGLVFVVCAAAAMFWAWPGIAQADPVIQSVTTGSDYRTVTVVFDEPVTGTGTGDDLDEIVMDDVSVTGAEAMLVDVDHTAETPIVELTFDGPVQPATAVVTIEDVAYGDFETGVPLAADDWTAIEASLRDIPLPVAEIPIAPFLDRDTEGNARTLDELLESMPTSLDLPDALSISRDAADGSFTLTATDTVVLDTVEIAPSVVLDEPDGVPYAIDLTSSTLIDLSVTLDGTMDLDNAGVPTSAALALGLTASDTPTLTGGVGIVEADSLSSLDLDVTIGFDLDPSTPDTPTVDQASAVLGGVTITGLGPSGATIAVPDTDLLEIGWPTLPGVDADQLRIETGEVTDNGWSTGGLQQLANVSINDLLGAPGGVASWLGAAQTVGPLATSLPVVDDTLGDAVGIAQSLALVHEQVSVATAIASGPLAPGPAPRLSASLCADLAPSAVRAAEVEVAIANLSGTPTVDDILDELPNVTGVDSVQITSDFTTYCEYLFHTVVVDLTNGEIETSVDIPQASFDFFQGEVPSVDLSYDEAGLGDLAIGLDGGDWEGTATPSLAFPLGLKLDPASDLVGHGLAVDLDSEVPADPPVEPDEDDVTAAYRIYIPEGESLGSSTVSLTGMGLSGFAQLGFVDLDLVGDVEITPSVSLVTEDPATGFTDGKVDLLELLGAAVVDEAGEADIDDVIDIDMPGDDVDIHFTLSNNVISTTANLDVAGDLSGLLLGNVDFGTTAITDPDDVGADRLGVGATFGDLLDLAEMTPTEIVALVADLLDQVASSAAASAGDERIPVVDVSLNEVAGFTQALSQVAATIRDRVPTSVSDLELFVNDALAANGLGAVSLGLDPGDASNDPELTLTIDASVEAAESYPISFELPGAGTDVFNVAPTDGGARLEAAVGIEFQPVLGIRFPDAAEPIADRLFVRDIAPRFDFFLGGDAGGSVSFGPAEASVSGTVGIGNENLDGGFTAELTDGGAPTIPLSAILAGTVDLEVTGDVPVVAEIGVVVPTPLGDIEGTVDVGGTVRTGVTFAASGLDYSAITDYFASLQPNLRTLADGAIETSRFLARGSAEVAGVSGEVPLVGPDVSAQFDAAAALLDDVADEIQGAVDFLESDGGDAVTILQDRIDVLLDPCSLCTATVQWTPSGPGGATSILDAEGIEVILTLAGEVGASTSASASFGLDPVLDLDVDLDNASANIGFVASLGLGVDIHDGFYLFPGDPDPADGRGNLIELYADLDLAGDLDLTIGGATASATGAEIHVAQELDQNDDPVGGARLKVEMPERLLISDIVNRSRSLSDVLEPSLDAAIVADIPVALGLEIVSGEPVTITLPLEFEWVFADTLHPDIGTATFDIVDAELDVGALAGFLSGVVTTVDSQYNPLSTPKIAAALDEPVPLIDETVRDVLLAVCQATLNPGCKAFEALTNMSNVASQLAALTDGDPLPIGSFRIFPAPPPGTSRYTAPGDTPPWAPPGPPPPPPSSTPSTNSGVTSLNAKLLELTNGYMTVPILDDLPAVMGIVLGGELSDDVDMVRFEIPANSPIVLGKSFAIKRTLIDLDVAFLEGNLSVNLNGGIGLNISGGFGYSTRGISNGDFLDGIFLIDNETIEVALGASVNAEVKGRFAIDVAGVDLASVNFRGSGSFSALGGIDLFDESPVLVGRGGGDGRLFFDEIATIADAYRPPADGIPSELCMFQLRTTGKWSLSFSGKGKILGITVFNETFDEGGTLWDETLSCELRTRIARVEDRTLILHAGPNASDRFDGRGDIAEVFTLTRNGGNVDVSWTGDTGGEDDLSFPLSNFDSILADMGAHDDSVTVAGVLNKPILGRGGPGQDVFVGGHGDDDIAGGPGHDNLSGGGGDDRLRGGDGPDDLAGGAGNDDIDGGRGGDTVSFHGTFGSDSVSDSGSPSDRDELDFGAITSGLTGDTAYGDSTVETGPSVALYPAGDFEDLVGGAGADDFRFKDREPHGFAVDGGGSADDLTFLSGQRDRRIAALDSGPAPADPANPDPAEIDTITVLGGSGRDEFLLRASSTAPGQTASDGFVARLAGGIVDRYDYDSSFEDLTVDGRVGNDVFTLDDNAAATHVVGGPGADIVQVGQIYGEADCDSDGTDEAVCSVGSDVDSIRGLGSGVVDVDDHFAATVITRGHLSNGVSHELVIDGDTGEDTITIFANHAPVEANGGDGNDQFVARAFIVAASVELNGDGAIDDFTYAVNDQISIDGGPGVDTFTVVGTEANDGIILAVDGSGRPTVEVCGVDDTTGLPDETGVCAISAITQSIEVFDVLGLEGDDVYWVQGTVADALVTLSGGEHSDRFLVGDGTLDAIMGPVVAAGDDSGVVPAIPDPVVLPNEDETPAFDPAVTGGTNVGDTLEIDASAAAIPLIGEMAIETDSADEVVASMVRGLGMAPGPFTVGTEPGADVVDEVLVHRDLEFVDATTGSGDDEITVVGTHVGNGACDANGCPLTLGTGDGGDTVDVQGIRGETVVDLGAGTDTLTVGDPSTQGDTLDAIDAHLRVIGGDDADTLDLDDTNDGPTRLDVDPGSITEAGLDPAGVSHESVEAVHVRLGDESDLANVRGTATDAFLTEIHGNGGDDSFLVSSASMLDAGQATDHLGGDVDSIHSPLLVHGDGGSFNLLQVSDRQASAGDGSVSYDGVTLTGLAPATIAHDVTGAFGGGITVWSSEFADTIDVTGSDRSATVGVRTLTTFNTGDGEDELTVGLTDGQDGPFVANVEEGADTVLGGGSSLGLVVFGGLGADDLTTGSGADTVFGDLGTATTADGGTTTGRGGPGDATDGGTQPLDVLASDVSGGDADEISTGVGEDVAIGGTGGDDIAGDGDDDILVGGHLTADAPDGGDSIAGGSGEDLIAGDNATFATVAGSVVLTLLDLETTGATASALSSGADTVTGGPDDDAIFGQNGDDHLFGDGGDDTVEGNGGADSIEGGDGQDDLTGGGSALDGVIDDERFWSLDALGIGIALADANDTIDGGDDADVVLGDNGWIVRSIDPDGSPSTLGEQYGSQNPDFDDVVVRDARVADGDELDGSFGADLLRGGAGADELHGQRDTMRTTVGGNLIAGDELLGGPGDDVLVGDLGQVTTVLEDGTRERTITENSPFLDATIHAAGTLTREVTLFVQHDGDHADDEGGSDPTQFGAEGDDVLLGDGGADVIHGGAGNDVANGGDGTDTIFGGDGDDAAWGGPGVDNLFGGHDQDSLDVIPRDFTTTTKGKDKTTLGPDPDVWFEVAPSANALAGLDIMYGGWNSDDMQADVKSNGPTPGDRLIDWSGAYNRYLSCTNGGGAGSFLRVQSPSLVEFLTDLAEGRGAVDVLTEDSSGHRELGLVETGNQGSVGGSDHVACP